MVADSTLYDALGELIIPIYARSRLQRRLPLTLVHPLQASAQPHQTQRSRKVHRRPAHAHTRRRHRRFRSLLHQKGALLGNPYTS